jgi:hypothetical protein
MGTFKRSEAAHEQNQKCLKSNQSVVTAVRISEPGEIKPTQLQ